MPMETNQGSDPETPSPSTIGRGRFTRGKWYCECGQAARCITTKKMGPNKGRRFWRCVNGGDDQCSFFLWVENEAAAKEWLKNSQLSSMPQTPTKTGVNIDDPDSSKIGRTGNKHISPQTLETPFTKAKRKTVSRGDTNHDSNDDGANQDADSNDGPQPFTALDNPSMYSNLSPQTPRKAARTSTITTPNQQFKEKLKSSKVSLPTPNSHDHISLSNMLASQLMRVPLDTSPTPVRFSDRASLNPSVESDLIATVLDLIRADNPELKASTEVQLRHEIGLILDVSETKIRRYEATICELRKRVDELETMVLHLT